MNILTPATLLLDADGIPWAPRYVDVYHSHAGGYLQAREVFMAGNGLPGAWAGRHRFVVLETGFGLGTNFLATWAAWRDDPRRCGRLHFVSVERHPFQAADLRAWHARDARMAALGAQLADAWPVLTPGLHRIELDQGRVVLTLALGDAQALLPQLRLRADALYLDGFSPSRNPEMWSAPVFKALARLATPGATLATYTVARAVIDGLNEAGFEVRKAPGFGGKRDMLVGRAGRLAGAAAVAEGIASATERIAPAVDSAAGSGRSALVIGAGIAGVAVADSLAMRGWEVQLLEGAQGPARGASSAPAGALHALLSRDDNRQARFTRAAYLHMGRRLAALGNGEPAGWYASCGRIDCLRDGDDFDHAAELIAALGLPPDFVRMVDAAEASGLAGVRLAHGGCWFPGGAWLNAGAYCAAVLASHPRRVRLTADRAVASLSRTGGNWEARDAGGALLGSAPVAVLAAGLDLARLAGVPAQVLPVRRVRGQLTGVHLPPESTPRTVLSGAGYCLPPVDGRVWAGATYGPNDGESAPRQAEHLQNLERLAQMLPGIDAARLVEGCAGHVGFRAVMADRLPLVGAVPEAGAAPRHPGRRGGPRLADLPRQPGLYVSGGMASRGLTWAALAGETIASMLDGDPLPLEADLLEAVDPARFLLRGLRRGGRPADATDP